MSCHCHLIPFLRIKPNSKNGFSLGRAKEHGRRHGNVPVIEVYIPFI
jgi:hypothetical protein